MVFRERTEGLGGPVPDLLDEASGHTWDALFEVSDNTLRALCQNFRYRAYLRDSCVRIVKPLTGATNATFDVAGCFDQTVQANCLVACREESRRFIDLTR